MNPVRLGCALLQPLDHPQQHGVVGRKALLRNGSRSRGYSTTKATTVATATAIVAAARPLDGLEGDDEPPAATVDDDNPARRSGSATAWTEPSLGLFVDGACSGARVGAAQLASKLGGAGPCEADPGSAV